MDAYQGMLHTRLRQINQVGHPTSLWASGCLRLHVLRLARLGSSFDNMRATSKKASKLVSLPCWLRTGLVIFQHQGMLEWQPAQKFYITSCVWQLFHQWTDVLLPGVCFTALCCLLTHVTWQVSGLSPVGVVQRLKCS